MKVYEFLKTGFWVVTARLIGAILTFLMTLFFARWLGLEQFGAFTLGLAILTITTVLARWGTDQILLKRASINWNTSPSISKAYVRSTIKLIMITGGVLTLFLALGNTFISSWIFSKPELETILFYFAILIVPLSLNFVISESYKAIGRPVLGSYIQNVTLPFSAITIGYFFYSSKSFNIENSVIVYGLSVLISLTVTLFLWLFIYSNFKNRTIPLNIIFKKGWPLLIATSSSLIMSWSDMIILGIYANESEIGIYSAASRTILGIALVIVALNSLTAPKYAKLHHGGESKKLESLAQLSSLVFFIAIGLPSIVLTAYSIEVMGLFGADFESGNNVLIILVIGQFVSVTLGASAPLLTMTGKEHTLKTILLTVSVINIILSIFFVKLIGAEGVAYATTVSLMIWSMWSTVEVKKHLGFWLFSIKPNRLLPYKS